MSQKQAWEMSLAELDNQIATTEAILREGYYKVVVDHLAWLQEQREERLIEQDIIETSSYAQTVLGLADKPHPD